ncbi:hypothetical protein [Brevibacillus borstelensis]|uniref:hypothetical protein n=1 Tax=Brevibacillus borstelensis TaxID=45462 RepID=UPI0030C21E8D
MEPNNTDKWLEDMFRETVVPPVDVKERVMGAVQRKESNMEAVKVKRKAGFFLVIGLLVTTSSVYAAWHSIQLKNEKGEVVYELYQMTDDKDVKESLPSEIKERIKQEEAETERAMNIVNSYFDTMKPGTAAAIYVVPKLPPVEGAEVKYAEGHAPYFTVLSKPLVFEKWQEVREKLGNTVKVPAELAGGLTFREADVSYEAKKDFDPEVLKKEAEAAQKEFVVKELEITGKLDEIFFSYAGQKGKVSALVTQAVRINGKITVGSEYEKAEKLTLGKTQAAYEEVEREDGKVRRSISWVDDGTNMVYRLNTSSKDISKAEFIKMVESYINTELLK